MSRGEPCNVSASSCLTNSANLAERRDGPTLGDLSILFAGTVSAGNYRFGFTLGGCERFSVALGTLCAGPLSRNVSASSCLTNSDSLAERRDGPTLGCFSILFAGTASAGNFRFGFTLCGCEGFSVELGTLVGVKGGTL